MFDRHQPHVFAQKRVSPADADRAAADALAVARERRSRSPELDAFAVHLSHDRTCVVTVEMWRTAAAFRADADESEAGRDLYFWEATGGRDPTPVSDASAGIIVIDLFRVPRLLAKPVAMFNARNGRAFNDEPGCIGTTIWRARGTGRIATYARWRSVDDFIAAFSSITGRDASGTEGVNAAAARMTAGLIRPDYHAYELIAVEGDA